MDNLQFPAHKNSVMKNRPVADGAPTGNSTPETGLFFYRARYYYAEIGGFISEDPIGFGGGDVNFYRYVANKPVGFINPGGLDRSKLEIDLSKQPADPKGRAGSIADLIIQGEGFLLWYSGIQELDAQERAILKKLCEI